MQWILTSIIQYKNFVLFLILLIIGILFSNHGSIYHQTKIEKLGLVFSGSISLENNASYLSLSSEVTVGGYPVQNSSSNTTEKLIQVTPGLDDVDQWFVDDKSKRGTNS